MGPLLVACSGKWGDADSNAPCVPGHSTIVTNAAGPHGSTGTNGPSLDGIKSLAGPHGSTGTNGPSLDEVIGAGAADAASARGLVLAREPEIGAAEIEGVALRELTVDRGGLRAVDANGGAHAGDGLVGLRLTALVDGRPVEMTIAAAWQDALNPELTAYSVRVGDEPACAGEDRGYFLAGTWDASGARRDAVDVKGHRYDITYSCADGVLAKCLAWGYTPWTVGDDAHETCTRIARADYCGDGVPHTVAGTEIDVFDTLGVQKPGDAAGMSFEAGWGPNGAVCVNRSRYDVRDDLGRVAVPTCWNDLPRCSTWDEAKAAGAVHGNASKIQDGLACQ